MVKRDHEGHILLGAVDVPEAMQPRHADADRLAQADADRLAQADADRLAQADADTAADADAEQTREDELHHG